MEDENFFDGEIDYNGKYAVLFRKDSVETPVGDINEQTDLRVWLRALLDDETLEGYKDVLFIVGNGDNVSRIKAHRLILATRSATFAKILKEHEHDEEITIADTSPEIFHTIIQYTYTGKLRPPQRVLEAVHLLHAAHTYDMHYLHDIMKDLLLQRLPHFRPRHFIMLTQRALDLGITDLEKPCFDIIQDTTDLVVMDPLFVRVSENFIKKLLALDSFSGITEAAVFARVLEWANLREPKERSSSSSSSSSSSDDEKKEKKNKEEKKKKQTADFELQKPKVRRTMESFIRDFRLVSIPKENLAGLVKNSGVFTEHEQLIVSYYLLDQTKNLGEFTMKPRGTKQKIKSYEVKPSPKFPITAVSQPLEAPPAPPVNGVPIVQPKPVPAKPANGESVFYSKPPPGYTEVSVDELPAKMHLPLRSQSSDGPYMVIKEQPDNSNFVDKLRQRFALDKKKGKESKAKQRGKSMERKPSETSLAEIMQKQELTSKKSSSSSSSSSAASSPAVKRPARPTDTKVTRDDSAVNVTLRDKPPIPHRPKSVVDDGMVVIADKRESKDVGKKGKNGFPGIISKTMKWSPERPPADIGRPSAPPRAKGHAAVPANNDVIAEI